MARHCNIFSRRLVSSQVRPFRSMSFRLVIRHQSGAIHSSSSRGQILRQLATVNSTKNSEFPDFSSHFSGQMSKMSSVICFKILDFIPHICLSASAQTTWHHSGIFWMCWWWQILSGLLDLEFRWGCVGLCSSDNGSPAELSHWRWS